MASVLGALTHVTYQETIEYFTADRDQTYIHKKTEKVNNINQKIYKAGSSAVKITNNLVKQTDLPEPVKKDLKKLDDKLATLMNAQNQDNKLTSALSQLSLDQRKQLDEADQKLMSQRNYSKVPTFYLRKNQGIPVGDENNFFGVQDLGYDEEDIDVTLNSDHHNMDTGDRISFQSKNGECFISYMGQASEGLFKFGLNCEDS